MALGMDDHPVLSGSRIALRMLALGFVCLAFIFGEWLAGVVGGAVVLFIDQMVGAFLAFRSSSSSTPTS
jgi:hypothetical protein